MKHIFLSILLVALGCAPPSSPAAPPAPRSATTVAASFDRTWSAVIDAFAARNIPIRTIDRTSGLIATDDLAVGREGGQWADCGKALGVSITPTRATYNVRVKGDARSSTVQFTVLWQNVYPSRMGIPSENCSTKGVWESEAETDVKTRAEAK
jgi:hypothetical protein